MRAALEQVEMIERYLLNKMTAVDYAAFESEMNANADLKNEVEAQRKVMTAIKRFGLRSAAASAYVSWRLRKWLMRGSFAIILVGGSLLTYYFVTSANNEPCVPCEERYHGNGHYEDAARPENCCENNYVTETTPEKHGYDFGFEIIMDTCRTAEAAVNSLEHSEENVSNGNNNNLSSNEAQPELSELERSRLMDISVDSVAMDHSYAVTSTDEVKSLKNQNTKTFQPRDPFLDSLQRRNDYENGSVELEPAFPGGQEALQKYLSENMVYPVDAISRKVQGVVYVSFVISKDGRIKNAKVIRGVDKALDKEAERIVANMPTWVPGKINGKYADLKYTIPVRFVLTGNAEELMNGKNLEYRKSKPLETTINKSGQPETL